VVGLLKSDTDGRTKDRVTNLVRGNMAPLPDFSVELYDVDDKPDKMVLVLHVEAGPAPPYGVKPGNPSYYLRRGATTFPASADQLRALARSRPPMARDIAFPWA
jgi:predicted HTH transcriptional regulator